MAKNEEDFAKKMLTHKELVLMVEKSTDEVMNYSFKKHIIPAWFIYKYYLIYRWFTTNPQDIKIVWHTKTIEKDKHEIK